MDLAFKPLPICLQNTIQAYGYGACMFNVTFSNISVCGLIDDFIVLNQQLYHGEQF